MDRRVFIALVKAVASRYGLPDPPSDLMICKVQAVKVGVGVWKLSVVETLQLLKDVLNPDFVCHPIASIAEQMKEKRGIEGQSKSSSQALEEKKHIKIEERGEKSVMSCYSKDSGDSWAGRGDGKVL